MIFDAHSMLLHYTGNIQIPSADDVKDSQPEVEGYFENTVGKEENAVN